MGVGTISGQMNLIESGVPNSSNAVAVIKSDIIIVDGNFQVAQLKLPSLNQGGLKDVTLINSNEGTLTITGQG